jgi:hypothetical protein
MCFGPASHVICVTATSPSISLYRLEMEPEPHPLVSLLAACFWVIRMTVARGIGVIAN